MTWSLDLGALLIGWLLGLCTFSLVCPWIVRRFTRNKLRLRTLIMEMYHKDLLPDVVRVEGLLRIHQMEFQENHTLRDLYVEKALKCTLRHKQHIINLIKKYEPYQ